MFDVKFVFLWTDAVLWLLVLGLIGYVVYVLRTEELARKWRKVLNNKTAVAAAAVLSVFFAAALADSVHYRRALPAADGAAVAAWDTKTVSLLDALVGEKIAGRERSYSAPFSLYDFIIAEYIQKPLCEMLKNKWGIVRFDRKNDTPETLRGAAL